MCPFPLTSVVVVPVPSLKAYAATRPGGREPDGGVPGGFSIAQMQ